MEKHKAEKYDTLYVEITAKKTKITIATIYSPPKLQATDDTVLYEEIKSVIQNKQAIIIGDLNCPNIDWATMNGDEESNRLIEMVGSQETTQVERDECYLYKLTTEQPANTLDAEKGGFIRRKDQ